MPYTGHCYTLNHFYDFIPNILRNRCQIFTSGDQVFKGKQEHPPGIGQIWHHVYSNHDLMVILITVDIFLPKVGLSDWARFDEKGTESVEPIFPYR